MTLKECYTTFGGSYDDTLRRLTSEALVSRFLLKFLDDKSYSSLSEAIVAENGADAFAAAHTLKGVALNLGLTSLYEPTNLLTEALRHGWNADAPALFPAVTEAYNRVTATILDWKNSGAAL